MFKTSRVFYTNKYGCYFYLPRKLYERNFTVTRDLIHTNPLIFLNLLVPKLCGLNSGHVLISGGLRVWFS